MGILTKEKLEEKVYWVIAGEDVRSGTYADALSDKADCLDPTEVPEVVDRVIYQRIDLSSGGSWYTVATHSSYADAEAAVEDEERIVTRRVWDVRAGKDLICTCDTEEEAKMERLEYLRSASIDREIFIFDCLEHAQIYHAIMTGTIYGDEDVCELIEDLVMEQAIML